MQESVDEYRADRLDAPRRGRRTDAEIAAEAMTDMKDFLQSCALRLELAAQLRAGNMDSESRHQEVAASIKAVMLEIAAELRAK